HTRRGRTRLPVPPHHAVQGARRAAGNPHRPRGRSRQLPEGASRAHRRDRSRVSAPGNRLRSTPHRRGPRPRPRRVPPEAPRPLSRGAPPLKESPMTRVFLSLSLVAVALIAFAADEAPNADKGKPLFNGTDFTGWLFADGKPVTKGWVVKDAAMV